MFFQRNMIVKSKRNGEEFWITNIDDEHMSITNDYLRGGIIHVPFDVFGHFFEKIDTVHFENEEEIDELIAEITAR